MRNNIKIQRIYMPGSEWLYYKIYSGPKNLELILLNELNTLIESLIEKKVIDKFFFLRYNDPDYHLRVRLHITNVSNCNIIMQAFKQKIEYYLTNRLIWKIHIDTYAREIERYGNNTIEDVESLFFYNSKAALKIINFAEKGQIHDRWIWGIKYIDMLLEQFGLKLSDKITLFDNLSKGYCTEFNMNKSLRVSLDSKLRNNQSQIEDIISLNDGKLSPLLKALLININNSKPVIENILKFREAGELEMGFDTLLGSIIHMHYNRLFRTQQRLYELVIYYSMFKFYKSMAARIKYNQSEMKIVSK